MDSGFDRRPHARAVSDHGLLALARKPPALSDLRWADLRSMHQLCPSLPGFFNYIRSGFYFVGRGIF